VGYARILKNSSYAFYDLISDDQITDLTYITSRSILFIITVDVYPVRSGRWVKIGTLPLELEKLPMNFMQDIIDLNQLSLYDPNTGEITERVTFEQCIGLERTASWEAEHVESRICDHFAGELITGLSN